MTRNRTSAVLAFTALALSAITLFAHLPTTLRGLSAEARKNDAYSAEGRVLASADSIDIDNGFVTASLDTVPPGATYVALQPPGTAIKKGLIPQITFDAIPLYMRYVLLPRRPASARSAAYILCYGCDLPHGVHVRWLWLGGDGAKMPGLKIGRRLSSR